MRLADFIEQNSRAIIEDAVRFAESQAPSAADFSLKELRDHLPQILQAIVGELRSVRTDDERAMQAQGHAPVQAGPESAASYHGRTRAVAGFGLNQMVAEYRALRVSVLKRWADSQALVTASIEDILRFNEAIDQAVAESLAQFSAEVESWRQIFLAALGHDLRGPLAAVMFSADMLSEELQDPLHARQIEMILNGSMRMTKLLDDLLIYSRSKLGGGMKISAEPCDLASALGEEIDLLRASLPTVSIRYSATGDTSGCFDASSLREALHNLTTNAAKYGHPDTDVVVAVAGHPRHVLITVANAGEQLSEDVLRTMFDPLRRGPHNASQGEHTSLGLGLFLVREISRAHGGSVEAHCLDGITTFSITLPRQP
ncbi:MULTISPECIES: sensor histidine kinase [unclassified Stenotrophomonas]|uniref:sensor histidine kinase n=1 Tax=unclassified Stenotrophomonas TaxID=196198 RepID=UPI0010457C6C|nr:MULTISPECIES: sensor histidine kinase [unclassified Stenotrophomonas]MDV3514215.1 sensor histidine kinase [Stenotrophomonas sp. C1657]TDB33841.1 two-component sensor histidine kinase [Stenotrophomonas sp. TEPEL]